MMATQEQKTVAFVLYPGLTLLDLVGSLQVEGRMGEGMSAAVAGPRA